MATVEAILASATSYFYTEIIIGALFFLLVLYLSQRNGLPFNWPLIGMLPTCFPRTLHICDHATKLIELYSGTFVFKGPWFADIDMKLTADPRNVQHVLGTNFSNYPKGGDIRKIFEAYGEILFTSDHDAWRRDRKLMHAFLHNQRLHEYTVEINQEIIQNALIPVLDHASEHGFAIDLQDMSQRYMLDATCMMITGRNCGSLRVGLPKEDVLNAIHDANDAIFLRNIVPETFWRLQRWLGIGAEKKLSKAGKIINDFAEKYIKAWKEQSSISKDEMETFNAIKFYFMEKELLESVGHDEEHVMREIIKGLIFGGTDTTSPVIPWFFWLLSKNPTVECKIRKEIAANIQTNKSGKRLFFDPEVLNKFIYLHAALCETLRLFPPVPLETRTAIQPDILPTGHHVKPNERIILAIYAIGRMRSIWGEDCLEFKPERWISERGGIKPMPSNKFMAFSAGPRICMGKEIALIRLKAVVATMLYNYKFQVVKNQPAATPATSLFLHMKHGLLAKVIKRSA